MYLSGPYSNKDAALYILESFVSDTKKQFKSFLQNIPHYKLPFNVRYTNAVKVFAEEFDFFWFLDVIASFQLQLKQEASQFWILKKNTDSTAEVICLNEKSKIILKEHIPFTDIEFNAATFVLRNRIIMFPYEEYMAIEKILGID